MFGIGWTEMLVIGVVALIIIGPKDLPVVMNRIGKVIGSVRRMGSEFQRELNKTTGLDQITDLRRSITDPLKQTAAEINREFNRTTSSGAVQPSGAIKPKDPDAESVVDEIHEKAGMSPPAAGADAPLPFTKEKAAENVAAAAAGANAVPAEPVKTAATSTAKKPRKPRSKSAASSSASEAKATPATADKAEAKPARPKKTAAPRKPRTPKPKAETAPPKPEPSDG